MKTMTVARTATLAFLSLATASTLGAAEEELADLVLRISPANAEATVDGKPAKLAERGTVAFVRVRPGHHLIAVKKADHASLEKLVSVPVVGLEARVRLAPFLPKAIVRLKSGRTLEGGLISNSNGRITLSRGQGTTTLTERMYHSVKTDARQRLRVVS